MKTKLDRQQMPKITHREEPNNSGFPVDHLSHSSMSLFSTNPLMFRIRYINGDVIDTAHNASGVLGNAFHHAIDTFFISEENDVGEGLVAGTKFIEEYPEGFINWTSTIPDRQTLRK